MKRAEAEKLLGGYATGTLTEPERRTLFAAALDHQDLFDALADEEALRELLTDPVVKAQLLAALSTAAPPKVVPFWRQPGILGAAAGLMVAATAGLAYLRSPVSVPPLEQREAAKAPAAKAVAVPPVAQTPAAPARTLAPARSRQEPPKPIQAMEAPEPKAPPAPASPAAAPYLVGASNQAAGASFRASEDMARARMQADSRRMEAQDSLAKKAEAPRPTASAALMEATGAISPPPAAPKAKASGGVRVSAAVADVANIANVAPAWALEPQPDGMTRVTVIAPRVPQALLLKRGASGVEVVKPQVGEARMEGATRWRFQIRLATGDVLDLYLLNTPSNEPAQLPETGPVDGFRARIYPAEK